MSSSGDNLQAKFHQAMRVGLLEQLVRRGPGKAGELAAQTGLSPHSVRQLLGELQAGHWVQQGPSHTWAVDGTGTAAVCLDLGGTKFYGAVMDAGGATLAERSLNHHGTQGEASYGLLEGMAAELLNE